MSTLFVIISVVAGLVGSSMLPTEPQCPPGYIIAKQPQPDHCELPPAKPENRK